MHWIFLVLAVVGEVIGTTSMKFLVSNGYQFYGTLTAIGMIGISYLLLSQATLRIPVALANAFWEGLGMILIAFSSLFLLGEHISHVQFIAIFLAVVGIGVTNYGSYKMEQDQ